MLTSIARFEIRYQLKSPIFWITSVVFFWFAFSLTYSDEIQFGWGGYVVRNSPYTIALTCMVLTVFAVFIATTFAASVVLRDDETGFGPIVRATPVTKSAYLFGRFAGGFVVCCLVYLSVPLGALIGAAMPGLDAETVGPFRAVPYLYSFFVLAVPTLFVLAAGVFAFATLTRSMFATYVVALVGLLLYFLTAAYVRRPEFGNLAAWFDPFGISSLTRDLGHWTPAERNSLLIPMAGRLLLNRILWLGLAMGALAVTWRLFKRERTAETKRRKETGKDVEAARAPNLAPVAAPRADRQALGWGPLVTLTRFDVKSVVRSPAFFVLVGITLVNAIIGLWIAGDDPVSITLPVTRLMIQTLFLQFSTYPLVIAAYYAGELVWRDRERRVHEILDATPAADWAFLAPKIIAITIVLVALALGSVGAAVLVQLAKGYTTFELGHYAVWYVLPWVGNMVLFAVLTVFLQTLVPHKFVGLLAVVLFLAAQLTLTKFGFEHNLYQFGGTSAVPLSDMNGQGNFARHAAWFRAYWTAFAAILTVFAYALWRRGASAPLKGRLKRLPTRLRGAPGWAVAVAALLMAGLGGYIYYNTNVLNTYRTFEDSQRWEAEYEKTLLPLEKVPQPKVTDVTLNVDLYPDEPRVITRGRYIVENKTGAPMGEIHISWARGHEQRSFLGTLLLGDLEMQSLEVDGARLTKEFPDLHYRIFTFDRPLEPGQKTEVRFETRRQQLGFRNTNNETRVVANGTFLDNFQLTPWIGMSRFMILQDRTVRRRYGLVPELRPPKLEDDSARAFNYFRHDADWVNAEVTVSTKADQTVVAPGHLEETRVVDGRRISHFKTESPINFFFSIQSARYAVREDKWRDVSLAVYYHPPHDISVDRMLRAMKASLDYYSQNFSPFQFRQLRIVEFPSYMNFAQAFPGTIPFSEAAGFIIDARDSSRVDGITYVTAHETGHQWWAHQVIGADMQGQTVLSETLAQYSALMVMERMYGVAEIRRFLKGSLDGYLRGRATDRIGEVPLARVEGQAHIRYQKGGMVMYLLRDVLGEEAVNRALRSLLHDYGLKGPPFATSRDLIDRLRAEAGPEHQGLITDLFEKITLYDLKVTGGRTSRRPDGKWDVTIDVEAHKLYADEKGVETEAPLDEALDLGVFTSEPGKHGFTAEGILSLERQRVTSGKHTYTVVVDKEPRFVGLDPYNKYVDRNSDDNVRAVTVESPSPRQPIGRSAMTSESKAGPPPVSPDVETWKDTTLAASVGRIPTRQEAFTTLSGLPIEPLYTPADVKDGAVIGFPGEYPYTRGVHPTMYRARPWTIRQVAGFGTAEDTNGRFKYLLAHGETGLSTDFDLPTLLGYDSDHPVGRPEVGKIGVAVDTVEDVRLLMQDIPLDQVSTSYTINASAFVLMGMYETVAKAQGVRAEQITGTIQNDILKEYTAQNEYIYPPAQGVKLVVDTMEYAATAMPRYNPVSVSGYHIRDAGSTAVQELAFTLAAGHCYVTGAVERGLSADFVAPRVSFFWNISNDFFEEICKLRASRRLWARMMRDWVGAKDPRSWMMRAHSQTSGVSLTAQQPDNNIARTAIQALAAILGGTQSLHTNSKDEAFQIPSEGAIKIAVRTQQILALENRVADVVDPLGGSYYVESLTTRLEEEAESLIRQVLDRGGMVRSIEDGFIQRQIADASAAYQQSVESGSEYIVGVNIHAEPEAPLPFDPFVLDPGLVERQIRRTQGIRKARPPAEHAAALREVEQAARQGKNVMPSVVRAIKAHATVGEMCDVLRGVFGEYRAPIVY